MSHGIKRLRGQPSPVIMAYGVPLLPNSSLHVPVLVMAGRGRERWVRGALVRQVYGRSMTPTQPSLT